MRIDYGIISVILEPGISENKISKVIKLTIENQLFTTTQKHIEEIINQCTLAASFMSSLKTHWYFPEYEYTYILKEYERN